MPGLFITATGTDVGKTFVGCALIRALRSEGRAVEAFKPVLSGYDGFAGSDAALLLGALGKGEADLDRMSPLRFAAPLAPPSAARIEGWTLDYDDVLHLCQERLAETDFGILLIEGAGGVMSPIAERATNLDLIEALGLPAVLVAGSYLGSVSHTLTALEALASREAQVAAIVVSESADTPVLIGEMADALETFAPGVPVVLAPRRATWDAGPLVPHVA